MLNRGSRLINVFFLSESLDIPKISLQEKKLKTCHPHRVTLLGFFSVYKSGDIKDDNDKNAMDCGFKNPSAVNCPFVQCSSNALIHLVCNYFLYKLS